MLEKKYIKELSALYKIANRGNKQNALTLGKYFSNYISLVGKKINEETKDPVGKLPLSI